MKKYLIPIIALVILSSCCSNQNDEKKLIASILPIKTIVARITNNDFPIVVLVPPGASPELYEPTPAQMVEIAQAKLIFTTGLIDFEQELVDRLADNPSVKERIVNLSKGIDLIADQNCNHALHHQYTHHHGVDPHIWSSPSGLRKMAENVYRHIALLYPDSIRYRLNFNELMNEIDLADQIIRAKTETSDIKYFLIYHPALAYWAKDYGIEQVALEHNGKEPSVDHMREIITLAREHNIKKVFYQAQFSRQTVEALAREIDGVAVEIDPLAEDAIGNIVRITDLIISN